MQKGYPHSTRAYGAATIDFINESVKLQKPFCMSLFFKAPHRPIEPDPMFDHVYENTDFRKLPNYGRKAGEHLAEQSRMGRQYPRFVQWGYDQEDTYQNALRKIQSTYLWCRLFYWDGIARIRKIKY